MSLKCPGCGLSNFATATACKRCHAPLDPKSSSANIWRDGKYLVLNLHSFVLPDRCLKCNTDRYVSLEVLEINYYPFYSYLTILPHFHAVFWTNYEIPAFLCTDHHRIALDGPKNTMMPNIFIIVGVISLIMAVVVDEAAMLFLPIGIAVLGFGLLLFKWTSHAFKIKKRTKTHVWIKGVAPEYLALLPKHQ